MFLVNYLERGRLPGSNLFQLSFKINPATYTCQNELYLFIITEVAEVPCALIHPPHSALQMFWCDFI